MIFHVFFVSHYFFIFPIRRQCTPTVRMCRQCRYVLDAVNTAVISGILCARPTRLWLCSPLTPLNAVVVKGHKKDGWPVLNIICYLSSSLSLSFVFAGLSSSGKSSSFNSLPYSSLKNFFAIFLYSYECLSGLRFITVSKSASCHLLSEYGFLFIFYYLDNRNLFIIFTSFGVTFYHFKNCISRKQNFFFSSCIVFS